MKLLDTTTRLLQPTEAERVARGLTDEDEGWSYTAVHDPQGTGWSFIEIRERGTGILVGRW